MDVAKEKFSPSITPERGTVSNPVPRNVLVKRGGSMIDHRTARIRLVLESGARAQHITCKTPLAGLEDAAESGFVLERWNSPHGIVETECY